MTQRRSTLLLDLTVLAAAALLLADTANAVAAHRLTPLPQLRIAPWLPDSESTPRPLPAVRGALFTPSAPELAPPAPPTPTPPTSVESCPRSPLGLQLQSTVVGSGPGLAVLRRAGRGSFALTAGESLPGDAERVLIEVQRRRVLLSHGGACERIEMTPGETTAAPQPTPPPGHQVVTRAQIDDALANLPQLMTQARVAPTFRSGEVDGFKIFAIRPRSLFARLGLRNGDVLQGVDGQRIRKPKQAWDLLEKLPQLRTVRVDLKRRGKPHSLHFEIR